MKPTSAALDRGTKPALGENRALGAITSTYEDISVKLFQCPTCQKPLFFENTACTNCKTTLLYLPVEATFGALTANDPQNGITAAVVTSPEGVGYRPCANHLQEACNWGTVNDEPEPFCRACRLNALIPNLGDPAAKAAWLQIEAAKRRLVYTLLGLGLPVQSKSEQPQGGLAFSFKQDEDGGQTKVLTGHEDGLITLNVAEANSPLRERTRVELGEPYRTLVGHFRHEIGHYYWDVLVRDSPRLDDYRKTFGDEREDYALACQKHYEQGPPPNWPNEFVSAYASTHSWEDWAETWAHYLHMVDTLETARAYGLALRPSTSEKSMKMSATQLDFDDFEDLIGAWVPLTLAVNSLNRGMGLPDMYPFALSNKAIHKLRFVHQVVESAKAPKPRQI